MCILNAKDQDMYLNILHLQGDLGGSVIKYITFAWENFKLKH